MKITHAQVENFRNLKDVSIGFNTEISYIIGENNIGKSNFLDALQIACNNWAIDDKDYADTEKPVIITMTFFLTDYELGVFGDEFVPEEANSVKLRFIKHITDIRGSYINISTGESIPPKVLKNVNFFCYEATPNSTNDLRFDKQRGVGSILSHIIKRFASDEDDYLNRESLNGLIEHLNTKLNLIKAFGDYGLHANVSPDSADMLCRLVYLMDEKSLPVGSSGNGVQYSAMAMVHVINRIIELHNSRSHPLSEMIYTNQSGKKMLPMIYAVDEPEIHLHPYMQRSLISYYKKIMNNEDANFLELIQTCFDIDGIDGQLVIVTHSTDALVDDYRNIIRFHLNAQGNPAVVSGTNVEIDTDIEKHLIAKFPDIKEAFYSRCVLIVEGITECGCLRLFANKVGISLDDYGICVVNAGGANTMKPLESLFASFGIPSVLIFDGDMNTKRITTPRDNEFYTTELCFEIEIVNLMIQGQEFDLLESIVCQIDSQAMTRLMQAEYLKKPLSKFAAGTVIAQPQTLAEVTRFDNRYAVIYASWFYKQKGVILGRIMGANLPSHLIPSCYKAAIQKAKETSQNDAI